MFPFGTNGSEQTLDVAVIILIMMDVFQGGRISIFMNRRQTVVTKRIRNVRIVAEVNQGGRKIHRAEYGEVSRRSNCKTTIVTRENKLRDVIRGRHDWVSVRAHFSMMEFQNLRDRLLMTRPFVIRQPIE